MVRPPGRRAAWPHPKYHGRVPGAQTLGGALALSGNRPRPVWSRAATLVRPSAQLSRDRQGWHVIDGSQGVPTPSYKKDPAVYWSLPLPAQAGLWCGVRETRPDVRLCGTSAGTWRPIPTGSTLTRLTGGASCKGYHARALLKDLDGGPWKTRIAEPQRRGVSRWHGDKDARRAVYNNRTRLRSEVGQQAMRNRAELVERSFAHILDRGGMRRTWLRGRENVHKRYLIHVAGHNLGLLMRLLIGAGTPKEAMAGGWCFFVLLPTSNGAYEALIMVFVAHSAMPALIVFRAPRKIDLFRARDWDGGQPAGFIGRDRNGSAWVLRPW